MATPPIDNPFEASDSRNLVSGANEAGALDAVPLEVGAIAERCWALFQSRMGVVLGAVLIPAIPAVANTIAGQVLQLLAEQTHQDTERLTFLLAAAVVQIVSSLIAVWLSLGQVRIFTRVVRGLDAELAMLFGEVRHYLGALLALFVMGMVGGLGLLLFVVPGIVVLIGLQFCLYAMVDQDLGPIESLQESWRLTDGHKLQLFVLGLAFAVITFAATCLTFGLAYFVAVPVLSLAQGVMYHSLVAEKGPARA